jgi:hypothetical protein
MTHQIEIGGEPRTIAEFSAYKAGLALEYIDRILDQVGDIGEKLATYGATYRRDHAERIPRAEARRRFRPLPMLDPNTEGTENEQLLTDAEGKPMLGPDPLGHLTEEDWQASGNALERLGSPPTRFEEVAYVFHLAMSAGARELVQELVTLVLTPNGDLEKWDIDESTDVKQRLGEETRQLVHRVKGSTFWLEAVIVAAELIEEDFGGTIRDLGNRMGNVGRLLGVGTTEEPEREGPPPMSVEIEDDPSKPTSSASEADSDGAAEPPSTAATASPSASSSTSAIA